MTPRTQPDPRSAALQMAVQPTLATLDELLAAIRALQSQADQDITRLLEQNAELLAALNHAVAVLDEDGCDCGDANDPPCALCEAQAAIAIAGLKPCTRTDADVEDDLRAIGEESGR